ncbi:hypothetical protein SUGI_0558420 [Cryptomeria japonica]|nr:hypothetical protein SUGI_0558420 [Cryptomeria japonica]
MPFGLALPQRKRRSKSQDQNDPWLYKPLEYWQLENKQFLYINPQPSVAYVFTLRELLEATSNFCNDNLIGKGGFGRVYKGVLKMGKVVAIKQMDPVSLRKAQGEREFRVEVDLLSRLNHTNLVRLIGYCADGNQRLLVYEYMYNGSLQDHLHGILRMRMDWPLRLKIALGTAKGLAYLHSGPTTSTPIIHRDFKSSNILLDADFEPRISDFGLAKLMPFGDEVYVSTRVLGTFGYFDPEYTSTGKLTLQTDVYAFGVVLLELLTGRRPVDLNQCLANQNLVSQVRNKLKDKRKLKKVIDPEVNRTSYGMESVSILANLAYRCVRKEANRRPDMSQCVKELEHMCTINKKETGSEMTQFCYQFSY